MSRAKLDVGLVVLSALGVFVLGVALANQHILGIGHDEGIYLATARSLAENASYRLINLPGTPPATKYPPAYPLLLAAVWKVRDAFPGNLVLLKAVNAALLGVIAALTFAWLGRLPRVAVGFQLVGMWLVASSPGLLSYCDLLLSEPLFVALLLGILFVDSRRATSVQTSNEFLIGLLAGLAALTRVVGVGLVVAAIWHVAARGGWRRALWTVVPSVILVGAWFIWRILARGPVSELLVYYVEYEKSSWSLLAVHPLESCRILLLNAYYYLHAAPIVFGWPIWPLTLAAIALGSRGLVDVTCRRALALPLRMLLIYCVLTLGHPFPMARYLTPLVPLVCVIVVVGASQFLDRRDFRPIAIMALLAFALSNALWVSHFWNVTHVSLHREFGRASVIGWEGFAETIDWLRANTPQNAVLASGNDPLYFSYTGRRGVRPWPHRRDLYSRSNDMTYERPNVEKANADLRRLGVEYLIVDPLPSEDEGVYASALLEAIVSQPAGPWQEVFSSRDGSHRVYRWRG
jgi:hypothetical protein